MRFSDVCVHEFYLNDVDDVEIYVAEPIWEWQQTEVGKWVMENSIEPPSYSISASLDYMGYRCVIRAVLKDEDATFFNLKYCDHVNRKTMG